MEALGLERTDKIVCKHCKHRFFCYTTREIPTGGICDNDEFIKLDYEVRKQICIEKAKKQGHYFPTTAG